MGAIECLRNRLTQRTVFGIIDDHRGPRDGLKRQPMQTDCAAQRANGDNTSKATKHGAQPSESADMRQSLDQRLFINMVTLCLPSRNPFSAPVLRGAMAIFPRFQVGETN